MRGKVKYALSHDVVILGREVHVVFFEIEVEVVGA